MNSRSSVGPTRDPLAKDTQFDRGVVAAITAGDPAGTVMVYDKYAPALYGYCHWMLDNPAETADALQDTFVIASATLTGLSDPSMLRPWLFGLAGNECRRRIRAMTAIRDEQADAANRQVDAKGQPPHAADWLMDATMPMPVIAWSTDAAPEAIDATMPFRVVSQWSGVAVKGIDATMPMPVVSQWPGIAAKGIDATMPMPVVSQWPHPAREAIDATLLFRKVSQPIDATDRVASVNGDPGQAELRTLIHSILAELRPREREVIQLSLTHDLNDDDLAIALGVSGSRAHALAARARGRLEKTLDALLVALTRRDACPELGKLLADWDGRLTKQARNTVDLHLIQCHTCANHGQGALRPAAFSRLLPPASLPPELRAQVLNRCSSPADDAAAYRGQVLRRAESTWFSRFSEAIRWRWDSIRSSPGAVIATVAVAVWAAAAVGVALLIFSGSNTAHAQTTRPSIGTSSSSPAAPAVATTAPAAALTSASARPSRTIRPSATYVQPVYVPPASPTVLTSPSASPTPSKSPTPSTSPTPSPSPSGSPSPSPSGTPSTSPSPSPTRKH